MFYASITPSNGDEPIWISAEDLTALQKEVVTLIEKHGRAFVRLIVNGKPCRISKAQQVFFMENPEDGKPPIPLASPSAPVFENSSEVEYLVPRPHMAGD